MYRLNKKIFYYLYNAPIKEPTMVDMPFNEITKSEIRSFEDTIII